MITLDGSYLEGGGAIVRVALALSALTQKPFAVEKIRQGRRDPGLKAQHVYCVEGLKKLCNATATGAELGSTTLTFIPGPLQSKTITLDIGTAGSVTLLMQALLIPSIFAPGRVHLKLKGGTDTKWAMPVDYFRAVVLPHLRKYAAISCTVKQRGYYPKGNGHFELIIKPRYSLSQIHETRHIGLLEQGTLAAINGISHASQDLAKVQVAERMASSAKTALAADVPIKITAEYCNTLSTGAGITLWALFQNSYGEVDENNPIILGADGLGEKGKPAETVGKEAAQRLQQEIQSKACVDAHLADNLIPFMALNPPSAIRTSPVTKHTLTNIYVVEQFLPVKFSIEGTLIRCLAKE